MVKELIATFPLTGELTAMEFFKNPRVEIYKDSLQKKTYAKFSSEFKRTVYIGGSFSNYLVFEKAEASGVPKLVCENVEISTSFPDLSSYHEIPVSFANKNISLKTNETANWVFEIYYQEYENDVLYSAGNLSARFKPIDIINIPSAAFQFNNDPVIDLFTGNGVEMYENDTILMEGTTFDTDNGDIVNVRYQINSLPAKAIATGISDGTTPILFNRSLTFKGGKLYDGATELTGALAEGVPHTLKVWAEDDKGGKSVVEERTFYVVPNRPPKLTINPFTAASDLIDTDKVTITGTTSDPDGNDTVVSYKLNNGLATEIYRGPDSDWSFDLLLSSLKLGENTAVVETVDAYNFKTNLTRKLNKTANLTPLAKSVQRYTLIPPAGTAQGLLLWIERHPEQSVTVEISMTNGTEQEQFVAMTLDSSGPSDTVGHVEDFFKYRADVPVEKIAIKLSWTGDKPIYRITGALTQ